VEDLVLGSETDEDYLFYNIWDIEVDRHDNIYVLDAGSCRIQKYDRRGKFVQTIGRQGQGPGEFERPVHIFFDVEDNIYILGLSKIHILNKDGDFMKRLTTQSFIMNIAPERPDNILVTGHTPGEKMRNLGIMVLDPEGQIQKTLTEFEGVPLMQGGWTISLDYSPDLRLSQHGELGIIYGYSFDYTLYRMNWQGEQTLIIKREIKRESISRQERNKILDEHMKRTSSSGLGFTKEQVANAGNLPKFRPFFDRILTDDPGRIYVRRLKSVLDETQEHEFDIFGPEGVFLYSTHLDLTPHVIKGGFMYHSRYSEETGETKVIRYRIKNWEQMKLD
jgi:hypothetical protein